MTMSDPGVALAAAGDGDELGRHATFQATLDSGGWRRPKT
jgi:hypothetical protein